MNAFRLTAVSLLCLTLTTPSWAQTAAANKASTQKISLRDFLQEVRENNPEGIALSKNVESLNLKIDEAELALSPYGYINYGQLDDEKPTPAPVFQGRKNKAETWSVGVDKLTSFGLYANAYLESRDIEIIGADPQILTEPKYNEARGVIELKQSLWRNGFGAKTSSDILGARETARADMLDEKFKLQQLLLKAESAYWALASLNEVIKLQDESVDRAKRMQTLMQKRYGQKLVDDVDYLQTQSAYQARELEWQSLVDERAGLYREFNTYRGLNDNTVEVELDPMPTQEWLARQQINPNKSKRADFEALRSRSKAGKARAKAGKSNISPDLDVTASYASNGRDDRFSGSFDQVGEYDRPTWTVGVQLRVPLDFGLTSDLRSAYNSQLTANESKLAQAEFQERRAFEDAYNKRNEAQVRFERMMELEKIQSKMVTRERSRLNNGRTTTFQMITFEQDLAATQIKRVRAQRELIETHNQLKLFQESL